MDTVNSSTDATEGRNLIPTSPHPSSSFNFKNKISFGKHPGWVRLDSLDQVCPKITNNKYGKGTSDGGRRGAEKGAPGSGLTLWVWTGRGQQPVCPNSSPNVSQAPFWEAKRWRVAMLMLMQVDAHGVVWAGLSPRISSAWWSSSREPPSPPRGHPPPPPGGEVVLSSEAITARQGQVWFFVNLE